MYLKNCKDHVGYCRHIYVHAQVIIHLHINYKFEKDLNKFQITPKLEINQPEKQTFKYRKINPNNPII